MKRIFARTLIALGSLAAFGTHAFERHHDAHTHGEARLTLVADQQEVIVELAVPAMDIVGFEHAPGSATDLARVQKAVEQLQIADAILRLPQAAGCEPEKADVHTALLEEGDSHESGHDHDDEHKHESEHEHEEDSHSGFDATYHFHCKDISQLTSVSTPLFQAFPSLKAIEVEVALPGRQHKAELTPDQPEARWQ